MEKRRLGKTEMYVEPVGLGCMGLTHAYGTAVPEAEAVRILRQAHEIGYDLYDTAEVYQGTYADGSHAWNETVVGKAVRDFRDEIVLASKFGVTHKGDHLEMDSSPEKIRASIEGSLERLGTDHIDLYYQHRIDPKVEPETVAGVMKDLIREGKIRAWGISEANEEYLRRANAVCPVTAVENRYSMMATWHEDLFPVCRELGITYVAFSPLANGLLSGRFTPSDTFEKGDFRNDMPQYQKEGYEKARKLLELLKKTAEEKNATMAQITLAWMLNKEPFLIPIPGSRKVSRLKENFEAGKIRLDNEEISAFDALIRSIDFDVFGGH